MIAHQFSRYLLLPADWRYLELARAWTAADPDHAGRVQGEFWIEQGEGFESWVLTDEEGPVFFFKAIIRDGYVEVHIQFPPYPQEAPIERQAHHRRRLSLALIEGMRWYEQRVRIRELRFDSRNEQLIRFAEKHLGFKNDGGQLSKRLEADHVR